MNDEAQPEPHVRATWLIALALVLLAAVAVGFLPALDARFLNWDDRANLVDVQEYRGLGAQNLAWMFRTAHLGPYQPLAWLSFAFDHAVHGLDAGLAPPQARGFHLTSVLIHALGALVFWRLSSALLRRVSALQSAPALAVEVAAAFGAVVYAVHPLRAESVAWVTERRDVLCALFYSLAALAYVRSTRAEALDSSAPDSRRALGVGVLCALAALASFEFSIDWDAPGELALSSIGAAGLGVALLGVVASTVCVGRALRPRPRERRWFALASIAFTLALLSKGLAMVLPAVLLVLDLWPLRRARDGRGIARLLAEKAPLFALAGMAARLAMWGQRALPEAMLTWEAHTLSERLLQACYGVCFYPLKTLAPFSLSPLYELPDTLSASDPRFALAVAGALLLVISALVLGRRAPWWSATLAAFVLAIAPVLGLSQAGPQLVADRYSVLACMPFALLAGGGLLRAWTAGGGPRIVSQALAAGALVALCMLTRAQTQHWKDDASLWRHAHQVRPNDALVHGQLANVENEAGLGASDAATRRAHFERAAAHFERELQLDSTPIANDLLNYGSTLLRLERAGQAEEWLRRAVQARPQHALSHANLGAALAAQGRHAESAAELQRAVELDPGYARGWHQLGLVRLSLGDRAGAAAALERCVALWPSFEPARRKLAELGAAK
jgi:tetratricopeptide (TPR) repeat protein